MGVGADGCLKFKGCKERNCLPETLRFPENNLAEKSGNLVLIPLGLKFASNW